MLRRAGIGNLNQLRKLGAVRAYLRVKRTDGRASLNLLWALEGALSNRPWQEVARNDRLSLLLALETLEKGGLGSRGDR
jgi:DNA transformation protein